MCGHITLHTGVVIHKPRPANLTMRLEDRMVNHLLHLGEPVLELVCDEQTRETCTDGEDFEFSRCVCVLLAELEGVKVDIVVCSVDTVGGAIGGRDMRVLDPICGAFNLWDFGRGVVNGRRGAGACGVHEDGHCDGRRGGRALWVSHEMKGCVCWMLSNLRGIDIRMQNRREMINSDRLIKDRLNNKVRRRMEGVSCRNHITLSRCGCQSLVVSQSFPPAARFGNAFRRHLSRYYSVLIDSERWEPGTRR